MFFEDHGILFQQSVLLGQSTDCMKVQSRTAAFVVRMDSLASVQHATINDWQLSLGASVHQCLVITLIVLPIISPISNQLHLRTMKRDQGDVLESVNSSRSCVAANSVQIVISRCLRLLLRQGSKWYAGKSSKLRVRVVTV